MRLPDFAPHWTRVAALGFLLSASAAPARARADAEKPVLVIDLNVGLERALATSGALAVGTGQAGYVELDKGNLLGLVAPISAKSGANPAEGTLLLLREALRSSDRFDPSGCAARGSRIRTWFELVDPDALAAAPTAVPLWVTRGVRIFSLAAANESPLTTTTGAPPSSLVSGLTPIGRDVVQRILAARALVDVSRLSALAFDEVVQLALEARVPVIATHVAARALAEQQANLSDGQLSDIARTGGLVALTFDRRQIAPGRTARIEHVVRQLKYLVRIMGAEHVAIGSGFETGEDVPLDLPSAARYPRLARALRASGLSAGDVERIFHGNAERILCGSNSSSDAVKEP